MAIVLWVALGLAYVWSVRQLARMSRPETPVPVDDGPRIEIVQARKELSS
jgi:hypothetical protein